jgi:hypothetical protein
MAHEFKEFCNIYKAFGLVQVPRSFSLIPNSLPLCTLGSMFVESPGRFSGSAQVLL